MASAGDGSKPVCRVKHVKKSAHAKVRAAKIKAGMKVKKVGKVARAGHKPKTKHARVRAAKIKAGMKPAKKKSCG